MCGTRTTFAQPQPQWYVGQRQVRERDLESVTGEEFRKIFPSEARGFSKEFSKIIPIMDGRLYMIASVDGIARPITRLVLYTESKTPSKCGAMCRNARGKSCDCSCKGENHGVGASFARFALADLDLTPTAALAQMGYRLGNVRHDPAAGESVYKVTQPNGSVVDMPAAKLTDFIYQKAQHMRKQLNSLPVPTIANPLNHAEHGAAALAAINAAIKSGNGSEARRLFNLYAHTLSSGEKAAAWASIRKMVGIGANYSRTGKKSTHAATLSGAATYTERLVKSLGFHPETTKFDQARGQLVLVFPEPLVAANAASKLSQQFAKLGSGVQRVSIDNSAEQRGDAVVGVVTIHLNDVAARGLNSRTGAKAKFAVTTYEQAEHAIALAEERTESMKRRIADRQKWLDRANALMHKADAGDMKAQNEVMQIANLLEAAMRGGFSRTGAKAAFAYDHDPNRVADNMTPEQRALAGKYQRAMYKLAAAASSLASDLRGISDLAERHAVQITRDGVLRESKQNMDELLRSAESASKLLKIKLSRTGAKARFSLIPLSKMREIKKHYEEYLRYVSRNPDANDYGKPISFNQFVDEWTDSNELGKADPMHYARTGAKAAFAAWRDGNMEFKTRTLGEDQVQVLVNEGSGWTNAGVVADETEAHDLARGYVANRAKGFVYLGGVWQKAKASRTGAKSTHAAEVIQKLSGGWVIEREGGVLYLAKGAEAIPVPSVEKAIELHKASSEGRLARRTGGFMSRTDAKSTHAADSLRALAVKLGYAPDAVTVEDGRGTIRFARNDGSAGRLAFSLRKPLAGVIASDRISVADDAVCIDMRGEA